MTIEEKANTSSPFEPHEWQEGYGLYESGFAQGAKWMLEKACKYIKNQYPIHYQEWAELADEYVEQFKKSMEE